MYTYRRVREQKEQGEKRNGRDSVECGLDNFTVLYMKVYIIKHLNAIH